MHCFKMESIRYDDAYKGRISLVIVSLFERVVATLDGNFNHLRFEKLIINV